MHGGHDSPYATVGARPIDGAERRGLTPGQWLGAAVLSGGLATGLWVDAAATWAGLIGAGWALFALAAAWRFAAVLMPRPQPPSAGPHPLPRYTVVAALYDEAAVAPQLIGRLAALDYPPDRLEGFVVLEHDDAATLAAVRACPRPPWLKPLVARPGRPRTKPRALNVALAHATGELITVYDAEDEPHPGQLREAAARFAAGPSTLACLQAPLRIRRAARPGRPTPFLDRQFAAEYAALFEVMLPALARWGLPFPLGGTSNHLKVEALRAVGGWDAWNVTEDADLGFRLWRRGWRLGVLTRPTFESPPGPMAVWLPQRTRWLKGYMQTWGVHMRRPLGLGWRGQLSLQMTLGLAVLSAAVHAPSLGWVLLGAAAAAGAPAIVPAAAWAVLGWGVLAAWTALVVGARRAGTPYGLWDLIRSPLYWSLSTLAFVHALWRLVRQPHVWDKTPHLPDAPLEAGREAA